MLRAAGRTSFRKTRASVAPYARRIVNDDRTWITMAIRRSLAAPNTRWSCCTCAGLSRSTSELPKCSLSPERSDGSCAPCDLVERVVLQRVHPAQATQAVRIACHLAACPVVLRLHLHVLVLDGRPVRVAELVRGGQNRRAPDARGIEILQQFGG